MPRIRTIKPEFWADEKVSKLPRDARLLFIGLFNFADDAGRLRGSPLLIRAQVFPYDGDVDSESLLRMLAEASLIVRYDVAGESYLWIRNFNRHQKIDKPSDSVLPAPPSGKSQRHSAKAPRTLAEASPLEWKGKEGKGKEGNGKEVTTLSGSPTGPDLVFQEWKAAHRMPKAIFTAKRRRAVTARLKEGYAVDRLVAAVRGCALDPFSMGENDRHTPFNDLELICRDGTHVEKFEALAPSGVAKPAPMKRKTDEEIMAEINSEHEVKNGRILEGA